jgi:hypothetical protein
MASTQSWTEYNGAGGTTATTARTDSNWKSVDDSTTVYSTAPVTAGTNSFNKVQALLFGGTYNSLSAFTYKIDNNAPATGISIVGSVVTAAATASQTATGDAALSTTGLSANFNTASTPFGAGTATYTTAGGVYAQALRSQLQTTTAAGPGDITTRTIIASWTES